MWKNMLWFLFWVIIGGFFILVLFKKFEEMITSYRAKTQVKVEMYRESAATSREKELKEKLEQSKKEIESQADEIDRLKEEVVTAKSRPQNEFEQNKKELRQKVEENTRLHAELAKLKNQPLATPMPVLPAAPVTAEEDTPADKLRKQKLDAAIAAEENANRARSTQATGVMKNGERFPFGAAPQVESFGGFVPKRNTPGQIAVSDEPMPVMVDGYVVEIPCRKGQPIPSREVIEQRVKANRRELDENRRSSRSSSRGENPYDRSDPDSFGWRNGRR